MKSFDTKLNNYEIERAITEQNLNNVPRNNLKLGFFDINKTIGRYHLRKQSIMPNPPKTFEKELMGETINADVPNVKHVHNNDVDMKVLNKENNIYSFNVKPHKPFLTKHKTGKFRNITSNFYGIPNKAYLLETNEGKMSGIYGKTNQEILNQNWNDKTNVSNQEQNKETFEELPEAEEDNVTTEEKHKAREERKKLQDLYKKTRQERAKTKAESKHTESNKVEIKKVSELLSLDDKEAEPKPQYQGRNKPDMTFDDEAIEEEEYDDEAAEPKTQDQGRNKTDDKELDEIIKMTDEEKDERLQSLLDQPKMKISEKKEFVKIIMRYKPLNLSETQVDTLYDFLHPIGKPKVSSRDDVDPTKLSQAFEGFKIDGKGMASFETTINRLISYFKKKVQVKSKMSTEELAARIKPTAKPEEIPEEIKPYKGPPMDYNTPSNLHG